MVEGRGIPMPSRGRGGRAWYPQSARRSKNTDHDEGDLASCRPQCSLNLLFIELDKFLPKALELVPQSELPSHISGHSHSEHSKVETTVESVNLYIRSRESLC